jgi:trehalose-phosphatase
LAALIDWTANATGEEDAAASSALRLDDFFQSLAGATKSALLLDFDGTLAPFRVDPAKVRPWAGVANLLDEIQRIGRTRTAIITGRPAADVALQLGTRVTPEIWGLHGAERRFSDGHFEEEEMGRFQLETLASAREAIHDAQLGVRVEEKRNAIVVHWRGVSPHSVKRIRHVAFELLARFADSPTFRLLQFDGGLELRTGRHKGDALRMILEELPVQAPVAYLGDDATDEHAFEAIANRGLSVLVRRKWRPGAAQIWLRPPVQLREFLASWLSAIQV